MAGEQPRADARRNVQKLVDAAREAVAEVGVGVTAHEIARRAGVGIGTFYRRLPSREALLTVVLADTFDELVAVARAALEMSDPWDGFTVFAESFARLRATSCGLRDVLADSPLDVDIDTRIAELRALTEQVVGRAQRAGSLRTDVAWQDIAFLLAATMTGADSMGLRLPPDQWRLSLRVILDGLRAPTA
ncbi:TetR/AcrR family transcriptional regulator [Streptomyces sp. GMY02]|uniref:TetR/AcrR family transcriptional regulator n=1 Tax=Streptomyces sp. GMY02 TaxID=1333528 RepID=UPI001C2B7CEA|nr:TetR/AcrR family transcriptional regulator [Streptomyces sp. GMY02]QXE33857.1 TetR/AcrR family transcriptional regulator [Streptomyces sp. GMY02]